MCHDQLKTLHHFWLLNLEHLWERVLTKLKFIFEKIYIDFGHSKGKF